jgi:hypothetical protein
MLEKKKLFEFMKQITVIIPNKATLVQYFLTPCSQ